VSGSAWTTRGSAFGMLKFVKGSARMGFLSISQLFMGLRNRDGLEAPGTDGIDSRICVYPVEEITHPHHGNCFSSLKPNGFAFLSVR
jgi:hypothetical protein